MPSYNSGLLENTEEVHWRDRGILRVESITIENKDGSGKIENIRAILQIDPDYVAKFKLLTEKIHEKSKKHSDYLAKCDFVDLIVLDRSYLFSRENDIQLLTSQLTECHEFLATMPFREIFVLGRTPENQKYFYYPIRGNVFLIDSLLLDHAFLDSGGDLDDPQRLTTLTRCLQEIGHPANYEGPPSESVHIPGWQLLLDGLDLTLRKWTDLPDLQPLKANNDTLKCINDNVIQSLLQKRYETHCETTITFPAHDT